ncbi:hypothetical protein ACOMHN_009850 [Nucella lapillus]
MKRGSTIVTYDVYITNFNKANANDTLEKKVSKHFTQFGETKGIFVRDNNQGKYGVVKYLSEPDSDRAVNESNGILLDGLPILVRRMEKRTSKPPGGGGGIGGGGGAGVAVTGGTWVASKDAANNPLLGKNPDIEKPAAAPAEGQGELEEATSELTTVPAVEPTGSASPGPEGEAATASGLPWYSLIPGSVPMLVTFIETPTLYWCQDLNDAIQLEIESVRSMLNEFCSTAPTLQNRPEPGTIYGAKFSEDGEWYRCHVRNMSNNPEKVKIQYVDYGNCEDVKFKEMVELPAELSSVKPFASKIMLHNTRYIGPKEREARLYLDSILFNQAAAVCPTFRLPDGSGQFAQVISEHAGSLNQDLIEKGFAVVKPPKQQQQPSSMMPPQQQNDGTPPMHLGEVGGYMGGGTFVSGGGGKRQAFLTTWPQKQCPVDRFGGPKGSVLGDTPQGSRSAPSFTDLKIDIHNKQRALEKASAELSAERLKIKNLQQEFQGLVTRMEENNIVNQLKVVSSLSDKVRQLRAQFSWDEPTALDEALELAGSEDKLTDNAVTTLPPLMTTLTTYRSLQQDISQENAQDCEEKLKERDALRKTLHEQLSQCVTEMEGIHFTERTNSITQCAEKLMKNYESYFTLPVDPFPDFQAAVAQYEELKAKKQQDFEQAQQSSDQQRETVQSQMMAVAKSLSLTASEERDNCDLDLLKQMKLYRACLQQEIAIRNVTLGSTCLLRQYDVQEESQEGSFLASLVKSVHQDLKGEMLCVKNLMRLQTEFTAMRDSIAPWLESAPTMDPLLENRQLLRSLKSKLRHKLADKHDAEENDEKEELEEIQKEVEDIQTEIHNALMAEEKQLGELAELVLKHFPEFLTLHPDSGLDLQLKYKGIVKSQHEISHYNLTPIPGANDRLFFSKFASEDIIIRECLLNDGHHGSQEEFLAQLMTYADLSHPALLLPSAVFFDKKSRHAYMCVEKGEGDILASCVQYGSISPADSPAVVRSAVEGLSALHARMILYGEINPFNILHFPDGTAAFLPPDFSCSPVDRAKNKLTTVGGLSFMAPELSNMPVGCEATGVVDMFSVGMLILFMLSGPEGVPLTPDGLLDVSKMTLEASAAGVVNNLLSLQPSLRSSADMLLASNYLRPQLSNGSSADKASPPPSASAVASAVCSVMPFFTGPPMQQQQQQRPLVGAPLPMMPPVNFQQPPPPLPTAYPCVQQQDLPFSTPPLTGSPAESLSRYSTPPPVESFNTLTMADPQPFVDPNGGASNPARNPSPFSAASRGEQAFDTSIGTFEAGPGGAYLAAMSGGFEEAALLQEQEENESRGTLPPFQASMEAAFGMGGDQGHFEIGTFSIQDVNGTGDNGKGRKITRQLSGEDGEKGEGGEEEQSVSDSNSGD